MLTRLAVVLLVTLVGCATPGTRSAKSPVQHKGSVIVYRSGIPPKTFDIEVARVSPGTYTIGEKSFSFGELVAEIKSLPSGYVHISNMNSIQDVMCVAVLGIRTNTRVFFSSEGETRIRPVVWENDEDFANAVFESC